MLVTRAYQCTGDIFMSDGVKISYRGREVGFLEIRRDGLMTVLRAEAMPIGGVLRLIVHSGDRNIQIGVMSPYMGRLRLEKRLSRNVLTELGISEIVSAELSDGREEFVKGNAKAQTMKSESAKTDTPAGEDLKSIDNPVSQGNVTAAITGAPTALDMKAADAQAAKADNPVNTGRPQTTGIENSQTAGNKTQQTAGGIAGLSSVISGLAANAHAAAEIGKSEPAASKPAAVRAQPAKAEASARWEPCPEPSVFFSDPELKYCCSGARNVLVQRLPDRTHLAFPFTVDRPFGFVAPFCVGEPSYINGSCYLVFTIKNGELTV
jgi:hypothetical protein